MCNAISSNQATFFRTFCKVLIREGLTFQPFGQVLAGGVRDEEIDDDLFSVRRPLFAVDRLWAAE